jgi:hypothetical protein
LLLAYGAMILVALLIIGLVWFGTRARRAHRHEHGRGGKRRAKT